MWLSALERRIARLEALFAARRERERRIFGEAGDSPQEQLIRLLDDLARRQQEAVAEPAAEHWSGSQWDGDGARWSAGISRPPEETKAGGGAGPVPVPVALDAPHPGPAPPLPAAPRFRRPCEAPGALPCGVFCRLGRGADCRLLARRGFAVWPDQAQRRQAAN